MNLIEISPQHAHLFDPETYVSSIKQSAEFIKKELPENFTPQVILTLGSGGLGDIASLISPIAEIPYAEIPGFHATTVPGHEGKLIAGYIGTIPIIGLKGRRHYYETGDQPNQIIALKDVTFPVYVMKELGAKLYIATNAAGGLNPSYKPGDLMIITSHIDLLYPNPLLGPVIPLYDAMRFQPQNQEYNIELRQIVNNAVKKTGERSHIHEGIYSALTGPTYETNADCQMLRTLGADAVGMSTVPEVIVATNLGMDTLGVSLIANVIAKDGTNATSHEEVMKALNDEQTKKRILSVFSEFFCLYENNLKNTPLHGQSSEATMVS
jgi:purine-nucleoside phosphorylase